MTVREAIENALQFIEAKHGHRNGDVYADLNLALKAVIQYPNLANKEL